jgi:hypothetical protein
LQAVHKQGLQDSKDGLKKQSILVLQARAPVIEELEDAQSGFHIA